MIDANTVRRIVRTAEVRPDDVVVEVGPGLGSLTLALLEAADRVTAVEIDDVLAAALPATIAARMPERADRFALVHSDAMHVTELPGPAADRAGRQPPLQRRRPGPAAHARDLPEHRTHPRHGAVGGRRPARRRRPAPRCTACPRSRPTGTPRSSGPGAIGRNVFWPAPERRQRSGLPGPADRAAQDDGLHGARSSPSSTPPSPSAARRCGPRSPAGPGPPPPPRRPSSPPGSLRRRAASP